jgi:hypothetical protein
LSFQMASKIKVFNRKVRKGIPQRAQRNPKARTLQITI